LIVAIVIIINIVVILVIFLIVLIDVVIDVSVLVDIIIILILILILIIMLSFTHFCIYVHLEIVTVLGWVCTAVIDSIAVDVIVVVIISTWSSW
jgi:hypothetical protein